MIREKSCGAVLFRQGERGREYLILTSTRGHKTLCKGHVEGEETEHETARREASLESLAAKVAGKVKKYRRSVTLEAMNAYERHVIHSALQEYPGVTTYSTGTEPNRRTVVAYAPGERR